jgi:hypothetical protein
MNDSLLRFEFAPETPVEQLEDLVAVATAATEGLCGTTALLVESPVTVFPAALAVEIDDRAEAGRGLARVFARLAERTLGRGAFRLLRVPRVRLSLAADGEQTPA